MTDENIAMQLEMCIKYGETRAETDRQTALKKGYSYLLFMFDIIINTNGVVEPKYISVFVKDLNDIFRLVKNSSIDLSKVHIIEVETGLEVDHDIFKKGE